MATYEVWLANDRGERLDLLSPISFEYSKVVGAPGYASVKLPYDETLFNAVKVDYQIHLYRAPDNGALTLYNIYFIRNKAATDFISNEVEMVFRGNDTLELLDRRIIAHETDSSEALKTDNADDMMKAIVNENMGSGAAAARDLSGNNFSIESDASLGPSITKAFAWKKVLATLQQVQQTTASEGTEVFFGIRLSMPDSVVGTPFLEFFTRTGQLGRDLRFQTGEFLGFNKEMGNLSFAHYEEDHTGEANYIYAGGQGSGALRNVQEVSDSARISASIWNRRELFANASGASTSAGVTGAGNERLNEKRPRKMLHATLLDTDETKFQRDWDAGDRVSVRAFNRTFDEIIRVVEVKVSETGAEQLTARFEAGSLMGRPVERIISNYLELQKRVESLETEDKV